MDLLHTLPKHRVSHDVLVFAVMLADDQWDFIFTAQFKALVGEEFA
jgi:hypothetical protein